MNTFFHLLRERLSEPRYQVLAAVSLGQFILLGIRLVVPALLPTIREEIALSLTLSGALVTVLWAVYALLQFPSGVLTDRIGERRVMVFSATLALLATGVLTLAVGPLSLFAGIVLLGVGTALFGTIRVTVLADIFEQDEGPQGIMGATGNLGAMVMPAAAGLIAAALGWRAGLYWTLPLFALLAGLLWWVVPDRTAPPDGEPVRALLGSVIGTVEDRSILRAVAMLTMTVFIYNAVTGLYPTYLTEVKGLSEAQVPVVFSMFFLAAIVIETMTGWLNERFRRKHLLTVMMGTSALALLMLPYVEGFYPLLVVTFLINALSIFWPLQQSAIVNALPDELEGGAFGLVRTFYLLVGSFGATVLGALADGGLFGIGFQLQAGLLGIVLVLIWTAGR